MPQLSKLDASLRDAFVQDTRRTGVIQQLLDIKSYKSPQEKASAFVENLTCLSFDKPNGRVSGEKPIIRKRVINAYRNRKYVAVSYTWDASRYETDDATGLYSVQKSLGLTHRESLQARYREPSKVRDNILRRTKKFMEKAEKDPIPYFWIDQHCINQENEEAKQKAMQAMDLVYSQSSYPLAMLFRTIETESEIALLNKLMEGELVQEDEGSYVISSHSSRDEAWRALDLLNDITSERWFQSGWTFQENYRGGDAMILLIPCSPVVDGLKSKLFKNVSGEICIKSTKFHIEATKICLAYKSHHRLNALCDSILSRVPRYKLLLCPDEIAKESMTPRIIQDLTHRTLRDIWDILPIIANCCQYSVHLNSAGLHHGKRNIAASVLALCIINGEIMNNDPERSLQLGKAKNLTFLEFLGELFFKEFSPPCQHGLTFNKGCRLVDVKMRKDGWVTKGHLWRSGRAVRTGNFTNSFEFNVGSRSAFKYLKPLIWLVEALKLVDRSDRQYILAEVLETFIRRTWYESPNTFAWEWQVEMAKLLAQAIREGKTLLTAYPLDNKHPGCGAILIAPDKEEESEIIEVRL